jgi:hypothetical protein
MRELDTSLHVLNQTLMTGSYVIVNCIRDNKYPKFGYSRLLGSNWMHKMNSYKYMLYMHHPTEYSKLMFDIGNLTNK